MNSVITNIHVVLNGLHGLDRKAHKNIAKCRLLCMYRYVNKERPIIVVLEIML